jgi:hypothetical protein
MTSEWPSGTVDIAGRHGLEFAQRRDERQRPPDFPIDVDPAPSVLADAVAGDANRRREEEAADLTTKSSTFRIRRLGRSQGTFATVPKSVDY